MHACVHACLRDSESCVQVAQDHKLFLDFHQKLQALRQRSKAVSGEEAKVRESALRRPRRCTGRIGRVSARVSARARG